MARSLFPYIIAPGMALQISGYKGSAMWMFCLPKGTPIKAGIRTSSPSPHMPHWCTSASSHVDAQGMTDRYPSPANASSAACVLQGALFFWSYVYYMSKFYEFIDTVLLVLKVHLAPP